MYQKRQKMIHMQLNDNNFDINHIYLQRRQLNIQDEEHVAYQSDEEEAKYIVPIPENNEELKENLSANQAAGANRQNSNGPPMAAPGAGLFVPISQSQRANKKKAKGGIFDAPGR